MGYAVARLILMCAGWVIAGMVAIAADHMLAGLKWPVFVPLAAWWAYVCAVFFLYEAEYESEASADLQRE